MSFGTQSYNDMKQILQQNLAKDGAEVIKTNNWQEKFQDFPDSFVVDELMKVEQKIEEMMPSKGSQSPRPERRDIHCIMAELRDRRAKMFAEFKDKHQNNFQVFKARQHTEVRKEE